MIKEYVILGGLLVVMGAVQIWLRYGPWAKQQQAELEAKRRAEAGSRATAAEPADEGSPAAQVKRQSSPMVTARGAKLWTKWTAILGPLGIALGLVLLIWGAIGG